MVEYPARDPLGLAAWYCDYLGAVRERDDPAQGFALVGFPGGRLAFKRGNVIPTGHLIHLHVENLEHVLARLADVGLLPLNGMKSSHEGYRRAKIADPEGNILVLFEWVPQAQAVTG
jgi:predicted enzyme related to lactoylglutathione lyase